MARPQRTDQTDPYTEGMYWMIWGVIIGSLWFALALFVFGAMGNIWIAGIPMALGVVTILLGLQGHNVVQSEMTEFDTVIEPELDPDAVPWRPEHE